MNRDLKDIKERNVLMTKQEMENYLKYEMQTNDVLHMVFNANDILINKLKLEYKKDSELTEILSNALEQQLLISNYLQKQRYPLL